jgi:hypothetical protein
VDHRRSAGCFGRKRIAKIISDTEQMKNTQKLPLLVDLQQKVGVLVLSITSSSSVIILENTLH